MEHEHEYRIQGGYSLDDGAIGVTSYRCRCGERRNKYELMPDFDILSPDEKEWLALELLKGITKESVDKLRNTVYTEEYFKGVA